jgi:hypothetical protein
MTCEEDRLIAEVLGEPMTAEVSPTDGATAEEPEEVLAAPAPLTVLSRLKALPARAFKHPR